MRSEVAGESWVLPHLEGEGGNSVARQEGQGDVGLGHIGLAYQEGQGGGGKNVAPWSESISSGG